jgi:hypothetical protein
LELVLSHEVAIVAARQKTVQLIDEQDGRTMFASPGEDLHKPFGSGNVGGSDRVNAATRLGSNQVCDGSLACTGGANQE